jgi:hypothetical protein
VRAPTLRTTIEDFFKRNGLTIRPAHQAENFSDGDLVSIFSALRNLFVPPHTKRSALAIYIHRLQAMAEWNAVVGKFA